VEDSVYLLLNGSSGLAYDKRRSALFTLALTEIFANPIGTIGANFGGGRHGSTCPNNFIGGTMTPNYWPTSDFCHCLFILFFIFIPQVPRLHEFKFYVYQTTPSVVIYSSRVAVPR